MGNRKQRRNKRLKLEQLGTNEARDRRREINRKTSRHHIIPKSRTDLFHNLQAEENIYKRQHGKHTAHHTIHENAAPHEIIGELAERWKSILNESAYEVLKELEHTAIYKDKFVR